MIPEHTSDLVSGVECGVLRFRGVQYSTAGLGEVSTQVICLWMLGSPSDK